MEGSTVVDPTHGLARNALGLPQVLFCIVTGAAPIAAMLFNDPWAVFGGGWAAPSCVHRGNGRLHRLLRGLHRDGPAGHGGRWLLQLRVAWVRADDRDGRRHCSSRLLPHLLGRCHRRHGVLREHDHRRLVSCDIPVWVFMFGTLAAMVLFAFFHIELTAKILGVFLVLELIALLTFGFCALVQRRADGLSVQPLLPGISSTARATGRRRRSVPARSASGYSGRSGHGSASRWRRTTPRSRRIQNASWAPRRTSR